MRSLRSFLAITSSTPSSMPLRPSFQVSSTRTAYWSTVSGCVVGTSNTAIWLPLRASNAASVCSSVACCWDESVAVRSVTRALSGGTATSASASPDASSAQTSNRTCGQPRRDRSCFMCVMTATGLLCRIFARRTRWNGGLRRCLRRRGRRATVDLWRFRDFLLVLDRELRLLLETEQHCGQVARERAHHHVVLLHCLDVAVARDRDAVLGALELRLQIAEVGVRLQLRIILGDHQQPRQRRRQLALGCDKFLECGRIVDEFGRGLDRPDLGTRVGHPEQHILFLLRETFDRIHQVRHQISAALILVDDFGPARLGLLVGRLQGVVTAAAETQRYHQHYECSEKSC